MSEQMNASEALYGFVGWITRQKETYVAGASHDCSVWVDSVSQFCKINNLPDPREGWAKNLILPPANEGERGGIM